MLYHESRVLKVMIGCGEAGGGERKRALSGGLQRNTRNEEWGGLGSDGLMPRKVMLCYVMFYMRVEY